MILVDASILIGFNRRPDPAVRRLLAQADMAVCGVTWAEVLHGARTPAEVAAAAATLAAFVQASTPEAVWPALGSNLASLTRAGITVPFQDVLLATVAIHHDAELWSSDAHFPLMRTLLPALRLFVPPPAGLSAPGTP